MIDTNNLVPSFDASASTLHVVTVTDNATDRLHSALASSGEAVLVLDAQATLDDLISALSQRQTAKGFDSLHLYSHAEEGRFWIGGTEISADTITGLGKELGELGSQLQDTGDILIYGCNVAGSSGGETLIRTLSDFTGADVAASVDSTGSGEANQDWDLEYQQGAIEALSTGIHHSLNWQGSLAVSPGAWVTAATYTDANGDLVDVALTGGGTFQLALAGGSTDGADAEQLVLSDTTATSSLAVTVTPQKLAINAGSIDDGGVAFYNRLYSPGYTTINTIKTTAISDSSIDSIRLGAAIVNNMSLARLSINNITLDTAYTTFTDRVNTSSLGSVNIANPSITIDNVTAAAELEIFDESPTGSSTNSYNPVTGLVDVGSIRAKSIGSLVVNGPISAPTADPYDPLPTTNNLRGTINVSESIGSIEAQRSALTGAIRAGSIDNINIGLVQGEVSTRDASKPLTMNLNSQFRGFIRPAGHLNLGFNFNYIQPNDTPPEREVIFGEIHAGGGISGSSDSLYDDLLLPNHIYNLYRHTGTAVTTLGEAAVGTLISNGIANARFNGSGNARLISEGDIGDISANNFTASMLVEAKGNIGSIEAYLFSEQVPPDPVSPPEPPVPGELAGAFKAGGNIGNVKAATNLVATLQAGGSIGDLTAFDGGIHSELIDAGTNIGNIWAKKQESTKGKFVAQTGNIGNLYVATGIFDTTLRAGNDIGNIYIEKGRLDLPNMAAARDIGAITVKGSNSMTGGTIAAGRSIGAITISAGSSRGIFGTLIQAGDEQGLYNEDQIASIGNIRVIAYGATELPEVEPGPDPSTAQQTNAIENAVITAGKIGSIQARAFTGSGIRSTHINAQRSTIASIKGIGFTHGLDAVNMVAARRIGNITGASQVQGSGIIGSQFLANSGAIGVIHGRGGSAGGSGLSDLYIQSLGTTRGISGQSNANGGHAIESVTANVGSLISLKASVLGGEGGSPNDPISSGIVDSEITTLASDIQRININVQSIRGEGIADTIIDSSGGIGSIQVSAFNADAIKNSTFTASQAIGKITAESVNAGTAISGSEFLSKKAGIAETTSIDAKSGGGGINDHGMRGNTFTAYTSIGKLNAVTEGGIAIDATSFLADSGWTNNGSIKSIRAISNGINFAGSIGMRAVIADAASIGSIYAEVSEFRGGASISESVFRTRSAVEESAGIIRGRERLAFNNRGKIGTITVKNASRTGNGIEFSQILAGGAGSIGTINVDMLWKKSAWTQLENRQASGVAIYGSAIRATGLDPDQNVFSGKIGSIIINTGRVIPDQTVPPIPPLPPLPPLPLILFPPPNDQFTEAPAGINLSYLAAYGGIGDIVVRSVGTGIGNSVIYANSDVLNPFIGRNLTVAKVKPNGKIKSLDVIARGLFAEDVVNTLINPPAPPPAP